MHPDARPTSIGDLLARAARRHPVAEALVDQRRRLSYVEYEYETDRLAWGLSRIGVVRGQHVALWMSNCVEWVLAEMAVLKLGAVLVPLNTRCTLAEAQYVLRQSKCETLLIGPELGDEVLFKEVPHLKRIVRLGDRCEAREIAFAALTADAPPPGAVEAMRAKVGAEDLAIIIYTSGTTSQPKGVMLAHGQIVRNIYEVRVIPEELTATDRVLFVLPMCHIMGAVNSVVGMLHVGGCLVLRERFEPAAALEAIQLERPTWFYGVTTLFVDLLASGLAARYDTSSLRCLTLFPGPFQREFLSALLAAFPGAGLNTRYGLTETTNGLTFASTWKDGFDRVLDTIGRPVGTCDLQIVHPDTRLAVRPGDDGEIRVRGFAVMKGYFDKPEETRQVIDADGWFYTGDLASVDAEGYVYFKGRIKDTLKTLGNNVSCLEVESVLMQHPAVSQAVLVGVPDHRAQEVGAAFVQLRTGATCSEAELAAHCRDRLAGYKVPRHYRFIGGFPLSSSGKVKKLALREQFLSEVSAA